MKKNLRIVSAAAAALLAVAPIAAAAGVSAAPVFAAESDYTHINLGGSTVTNNQSTVDVAPSLVLNGKKNATDKANGSLTGSVAATLGGTSYTANLRGNNQDNVKILDSSNATVDAKNVVAGTQYTVQISNVGFNFGSANAGKKVTIKSSNPNVTFSAAASNTAVQVASDHKSAQVQLDQNGTVSGLTVSTKVTAFDATNTNDVVFYDLATGNRVTAGSTMVLANYDGELNTSALLPAIRSNFVGVQRYTKAGNTEQNGSYNNNDFATFVPEFASDINSQLKSQNVTVDANGNFKAPHTFTVRVKATSDINGKSATLPVTVTVANVAAPAQETGVNKTIMHIAAIYDKNGKKTSNPEIGAYNTVSVLATPVELKDASGKSLGRFYKVANKDQYIKVGNIDGTSRTLGHNAYIYHRVGDKFVARTHKFGKKTRHIVAKKGTQETTYGSPLFGKKYYRIDKNRYIKVANFR